MFSDKEVTKAWEMFRKDGMRQVMELAVTLKANGGTMSADGEHVFEAATEDGGRVWVEATGEWGHEGGNISWALDAIAAHVVALRSALGARNAVLEKERDAANAEVERLKARCAALSAAGQVLSAHVDKTGGCANPDPLSGPTCAERGCEGGVCRYSTPGHPERVKERSEADVSITAEEFHAMTADPEDVAYTAGAEAMRAAILIAVREWLGDELSPALKAAIEGAKP